MTSMLEIEALRAVSNEKLKEYRASVDAVEAALRKYHEEGGEKAGAAAGMKLAERVRVFLKDNDRLALESALQSYDVSGK